jgi:hypothetical protein
LSRSSRVKRVPVSTSRRELTDERHGTSRTSSYVSASGREKQPSEVRVRSLR